MSAEGVVTANPIDLGGSKDPAYLSLFGTGIRGASGLSGVRVTIGSVPCRVVFAGASPEFAGLDQVNALIDRSLIGSGEVDVVLTVDGFLANAVRVAIR